MAKDQRIVKKEDQELKSKYLGESLVEKLTEATPEDWVLQRPIRGGGIVDYVPGGHFIEKYNECFGFLWSTKVIEHKVDLETNQIVVLGEVSVEVPGRTIIKEYPDGTKETVRFDSIKIIKQQFGGSEVKRFSKDIVGKSGEVTYKKGDMMDLADDFKSAATDSMKKCGTEFGMFPDVYGPREAQSEIRVSSTQLDALNLRGEKAGMTPERLEAWVKTQTGKTIDQLDQLAIMTLLPKLMDLEKK